MRYKYLLLLTSLISINFLASCNKNKEEIPETEEQFITKFKNKLISLSDDCSKKEGTQTDENYYGAITVTVKEDNTKIRYKDNFVKADFVQTYDGNDKINGTEEVGIKDNKFYLIRDYGKDDPNNYVIYAKYDENFSEDNLSVGFSRAYFGGGYDVCKNFIDSNESIKYKFEYNYHDVDLSKDGEVKLYLIYEQYSSKTVVVKYEREDYLTIKNNKIIKSKSTILYSLMDNTNYNYSVSTFNYSYDAYQEYSGTKLNPSNYSEKA